MKKPLAPPARAAHEWEQLSVKVTVEMKKKIEADMVVVDCHNFAEYIRFLLRTRFERAK